MPFEATVYRCMQFYFPSNIMPIRCPDYKSSIIKLCRKDKRIYPHLISGLEEVAPIEKHFDFKNTTKHPNRVLLEAEPQIGKTGVYLWVIL